MATATATARASFGNPDAQGYRARYIVKVEAGGIVVYVHRELAELVKYLLNETVRLGYRLAGGTPDDWSYANRNIRGKRTKSYHATGQALDLNALKNPMTNDGVVHTDMPKWMVDLWAEWGFSWGGGFSHSRKDPMHFEFRGAVSDARRLTAALRRKLAAPHRVDVRQRKPARRRNPFTRQRAGVVVALGAHGDHVRFIQWALGIKTDGDFGPITADAVKRFQRAHPPLTADGKVGDKTIAILAKITR